MTGFSWIGPVVLLLSALLTAGYLFPVVVQGFLPGKEFDSKKKEHLEADKSMTVPMMILAALTLLFGIFSEGLVEYVLQLAGTMR